MENFQICQATSFMSWESQAISQGSDLIAQSARESTLVVARRLRGATSFKWFKNSKQKWNRREVSDVQNILFPGPCNSTILKL